MPGTRLPVRVRRAAGADAAGVTRLLRGIYAEGEAFVGDGAPHSETLAGHLEADDPDRALYLIAVVGEALAGWLELHRHPPRRLRHVAVLTLAVAPQHRRTGVGRALMHHAYAWAERVGVEKISLNVRAGNAPAIALYRSEGFALEGCEVRHIRMGETYEDNLVMARFLPRRTEP